MATVSFTISAPDLVILEGAVGADLGLTGDATPAQVKQWVIDDVTRFTKKYQRSLLENAIVVTPIVLT